MRADLLIGLEGVLSELGDLYSRARDYTALRAAADDGLLPAMEGIGAELRARLRAGEISADEVGRAAVAVDTLKREWTARIAQVRAGQEYRAALAAFAAGDLLALARQVPAIFAAHEPFAGPVYFPFAVTSGRRAQGVSPFRAAGECVAAIEQRLAHGIACTIDDEEGLPAIAGADEPSALDTPIALELDRAHTPASTFRLIGEPTCRVYAPQVAGPFTVVLSADSDDEWWLTHTTTYAAFRDEVAEALSRRGAAVRIAALD